MAKIQPAVLNLKFEVGEGLDKFLDISQAACIVNRRFYRQGLSWAVAGFTIATGSGKVGTITISKLPSTWMVGNSWEKTYHAWKKQQDHAMEEAGLQSTIARYRDFKIFASIPHQAAGVSGNLPPLDAAKVPFTLGEWNESQIVIPNDGGVAGNSVEYDLHMVGPDVPNSKGMVQNYADSRSTPQSPDPHTQNPEDSFFSEMIDLGEIQELVVDNAEERNNDLPYTQNNYPGGAVNAATLEIIHEVALTGPTVNMTSRKLSGAIVPCGLLNIHNEVNGPIDLYLHLVPGPARGYMTQPMRDM